MAGAIRDAVDPGSVHGTSSPSAPAYSVEVTDGSGATTLSPLNYIHAIFGRAADSTVRLDSAMVSRHHAELTLDPQGRWWVRDLQSRNGTVLNGVAVSHSQVRSGDRISIGPFVVKFLGPPESGSGIGAVEPPTRSRLLMSDAAAGRISTLQDVEPQRLAASHLVTISNFSRDLLATADPTARLTALCRLMVGRDFHGRRAYALHLSDTAPEDPPVPLCEPQQNEDLTWTMGFGGGTRRGSIAPSDETPPRYGDSFGSHSDPSAYISQGVLRAVRKKGEAVLAGNTGMGVDVEMSISSSVLPTAAVAVPLRQDPGGPAILYVTLPPEYGNGEWLALIALVAKQYQQAEDAWAARKQAEAHAAVELELQRAHQIQMRLLPRPTEIAGLDLAIGFIPCRWVGGDYVDVVPMADGRTLLTVADVCGKGLAAALISSSLHTMVHTGLDAGMSLAALMASLNRYLCKTLSSESFVTMVTVVIDPATGEFECVNAGHPPALVLSPGQEPRELQSAANLPLACDEADPQGESGRIEPGQLLCLYTDGLTELTGPCGMLGMAGLCAELKSIYTDSSLAAQHAADGLTRQLNILQGQRLPDDDRTFLLARRVGGKC